MPVQANNASALPPTLPPLIEGTQWKLTDIGGKPAAKAVTTTLEFRQGRVGGKGGCNSYNGPVTVEITTRGLHKIKFGNLVSTRMACPGAASTQETEYFQHLSKITQFKREGDELVLFTAENVANLRFLLLP